MNSDLVFDLGLHLGEDTAYYLSKGYRVVAVDADARLVEQARTRFAEAVGTGQLTLLNAAIAAVEEVVEFHVSAKSIWNSLKKEIATRDDLAARAIRVPARRLSSLFREFGTPLYCKIDLEGWDIVCLKILEEDAAELPAYISVETECVGDAEVLTEAQALATLHQLGRLGYRKFKLVDQRSLCVLGRRGGIYRSKPPLWQRLGKRLGLGGYAFYNLHDLAEKNRADLSAAHGYAFPEGASGPFGPELGSDWLDLASAERTLLRNRRDYFRMKNAKPYGFWCDWHAAF